MKPIHCDKSTAPYQKFWGIRSISWIRCFRCQICGFIGVPTGKPFDTSHMDAMEGIRLAGIAFDESLPNNFCGSMNCRYCGQPIAEGQSVKTLAYWNQTPDICHPECRQPGERQEAIDCQVADADCNDCKHFKRGELIKRWLMGMVGGKAQAIFTNMGIVKGYCLKFDKPTEAYPHMSTGRACFEHRRL